MKQLLLIIAFLVAGTQLTNAQQTRGARTMLSITYEQEGDSVQISRYTYQEFNKKGLTTKEVIMHPDSTIKSHEEWNYDRKQRETEYRVYTKTGTLDRKLISNYDRFGNRKQTVLFNGEGAVLETTNFTYNRFGKKTDEITLNAQGEKTKQISFEYDDHGALIKRIIYDHKGHIISQKTWTYTY